MKLDLKSTKQNLLLLLLALALVGFEQWLERYISQRHQYTMRVETLQKLSVVRANLESILNTNLSLINGFRIAIGANPNLSKTDFDSYAREIMRNETLLLNFTAAPDMVVNYIYPLAGNEPVAGLQYLNHPDQAREAELVRDTRTILVAGPIDLVQGGRGLIGRAPVYYLDQDSQTEKFWGIVSAPMLIEKVMEKAGLTELMKQQNVAVRKTNRLLQNTITVFGDQSLFNRNPVVTDLAIDQETWQLASEPRVSLDELNDSLNFIRIMFFCIFSLIMAILFIRIRQSIERQGFVAALQYRESMLEEVGVIAKVGGWEYKQGLGFTFWSEEVLNIFEFQDKPPTDEGILQKFNSKQKDELQQEMAKALNEQKDIDIELPLYINQLTSKWIKIQAHGLIDNDGVATVQGVVQDITERKNSEATILKQANYDPLTHLPNRSLFDERLNFSVASASRSKERFAVLYIDLDRFKSINDSLGHAVGDQLLLQASTRFNQCIRESDTLSRRSGDEFTLIASQLTSNNAAELVAKNILHQLKKPFSIDGNQIHMSSSIGISVYPDDGVQAEHLLKKADQAMYIAKSLGRNTFCYFTEEMQIDADRRLRLHMDLVEALDKHQLQVYYQPIMNVQTGQVVECEALARWFHPKLGEISPDDFIGLAEEVGLIQQLGDFVTQTALRDISQLNKHLGLDIGLAINKSYREFIATGSDASPWFEQLIESDNRPRLIVEITESMLMEGDEIYKILDNLRKSGIKIAIDDFGTGYSSLSYLRRFPVDVLKIDRSFIRDIDIDKEDLTLVEAILAMANNLGLEVIAEGVETADQMDLLNARNCHFAQGFYYSRAMPIEQITQWLNKGSKAQKPTLVKINDSH